MMEENSIFDQQTGEYSTSLYNPKCMITCIEYDLSDGSTGFIRHTEVLGGLTPRTLTYHLTKTVIPEALHITPEHRERSNQKTFRCPTRITSILSYRQSAAGGQRRNGPNPGRGRGNNNKDVWAEKAHGIDTLLPLAFPFLIRTNLADNTHSYRRPLIPPSCLQPSTERGRSRDKSQTPAQQQVSPSILIPATPLSQTLYRICHLRNPRAANPKKTKPAGRGRGAANTNNKT